MKKIKIGIIGTGVGIRTHLKGFRLVDSAEVYAICGSSLIRSKEFAEHYEIPVACKDYKELCDMNEIDLVCITAPNKFHKEMLEYAIKAHKHIICEKPLVNTLDEARELLQIAETYDKLLIIDHQLRFNPYITAIKKLIDDGTLGNIYMIKLHQQGMGFADAKSKWSWSFDENEGGGVRLAMASHFTDLLQYWFGNREIVGVFGYMNPITKVRVNNKGENVEIKASTSCYAMINFTKELTAQYSINAGAYSGSKFDINVFGDKGELTFSLDNKLKLYLRSKLGECENVLVENVFEDERENKISIFSGSFRYLAPLIIDAIISNNFKELQIATTIEDAIYNLTLLEAIKSSANSNSSIAFNKETNDYV